MRDLWTNPVMQETFFLGFKLKASHPKRVYATSRFHLKEDRRINPRNRPDIKQAPGQARANP
jgi:hypothetical protein